MLLTVVSLIRGGSTDVENTRSTVERMLGVYLFDLIDPTGIKLYTFKLTQYNSNAPAPSDPFNSPYETPRFQYIYNSDAFSMVITYAYNGIIPSITTLGVYYTPNGSLTDPANGKFYLRFTTDDKSIYASQAGKYTSYVPTNGTNSQAGNYNAMSGLGVTDIVYNFCPAQPPSGIFILGSFPLSGGTLNNTVETSSILVPVAVPTATLGGTIIRIKTKATTYYTNRLLKMGYTMNQIIPSSLYTSYMSIYMTFPSYELRQLFMEGNLALNGCLCDKGRIY